MNAALYVFESVGRGAGPDGVAALALEVLLVLSLLLLRIFKELTLGSVHSERRWFSQAVDLGATPLLLIVVGMLAFRLLQLLNLLD